MVYRLKYEKREEVKYIGHLDCMRTFTRCIKRTTLPIKFSTGFNPRVQLSFALPLAVGVTSSCEYVDLELAEDIDTSEVVKQLNETLPDGFRIIDAKKIENSKSLMSLVKEAIYEIYIISNDDNDISKLESLFNQDEILIEKETKSKKNHVEEINLKNYIIDVNASQDKYDTIKMTIHSYAGSEKNLNPNFVIEAIKKYLPEVSIEDYDIHRKELIIE